MASSSRSFSETEKVNLLAEIIKISDVPPEALLDVIHQYRVEPEWNNIARPAGRHDSECKQLFSEMSLMRAPYNPPLEQYIRPNTSHPSRPYSVVESTPTGIRSIQPRPPATYPMTGSYSESPSSTEKQPPAKKRGRPSNAELKVKREEAAARGEVYPAPRPTKRSKGSGAGLSMDAPEGLLRTTPRSASGTDSASPGPSRPPGLPATSHPMSPPSNVTRLPVETERSFSSHEDYAMSLDQIPLDERRTWATSSHRSEPPRPASFQSEFQSQRHLQLPIPTPSSTKDPPQPDPFIPRSGASPLTSQPASSPHLKGEHPSR